MASKLDPTKVKEAQEELKQAEKALSTGLLKWKPDHLEAEPHFQRAARAFKQAGLLDSATAAWRKAADCAYKLGNLKQAAVTMETAGRELSVSKDQPTRTEAARLFAEAAGFLQEAGEIVRAADLKLRAAKLVETFDVDLACRFVDESATLFDGHDDKDVYVVEPLKKAMQQQLALGKHASAMRTMDRLWKVWTRLDQKHNLYKLVLSRVILLLAAADPIAAQREFERCLDLPGFAAADEAAAAEDLCSAYAEMDVEAAKAVLARTVIGFLEQGVSRIAKGIPDAMMTGDTIGVAKDSEAASKAVDYQKAAPGQFRELGGQAFAIGGAGGGAGRAAEEEEEDASTTRAARKAQDDASSRAALFMKPAGAGGAAADAGGASGGSRPTAAAFAPDEDAPLTAAQHVPTDGFTSGAEDYEAAFREMALGDAEADAADATAAPAAVPAPPGEEDLGLM